MKSTRSLALAAVLAVADLGVPDTVGTVVYTPDVAAANPVIGSGGSRHIQLGAKFIW